MIIRGLPGLTRTQGSRQQLLQQVGQGGGGRLTCAQYGQQLLGMCRGIQSEAGQVTTVVHGGQAALVEAFGGGDHGRSGFRLVNLQPLVGVGKVELGQQGYLVDFFRFQSHGVAPRYGQNACLAV